jgi:hypothetical protein
MKKKSSYSDCLMIFWNSLADFFFLISAITQNLRESFSNCNVKKREENVCSKEKIQVFFSLKIQDLVLFCGMKIIIFHAWLLPLIKYLFSYYSFHLIHIHQYFIYKNIIKNIWAAIRQNQRNVFAASMDPNQSAHLGSLIRIHAFRYQFLYL